MKRYGQFCPIAVGAEIFAERWTPLIVRELFAGSTRFNELQRGLPRIPKATLAQRLRFLNGAGVVERFREGEEGSQSYRLTEAGRELAVVAVGLGDWARRWGYAEIRPETLDPDFLMWDLHRGLIVEKLPEGLTVLEVDLTGARERSYWLLLERPEPSLCLTDPGFAVDLRVTADTMALHKVWVGDLALDRALRSELIVLDGPMELRRAFPGWLRLGFFVYRPEASPIARDSLTG